MNDTREVPQDLLGASADHDEGLAAVRFFLDKLKLLLRHDLVYRAGKAAYPSGEQDIYGIFLMLREHLPIKAEAFVHFVQYVFIVDGQAQTLSQLCGNLPPAAAVFTSYRNEKLFHRSLRQITSLLQVIIAPFLLPSREDCRFHNDS